MKKISTDQRNKTEEITDAKIEKTIIDQAIELGDAHGDIGYNPSSERLFKKEINDWDVN